MYCRFEERESKNNSYTFDIYNEEQFCKVYHLYELDFIMCLKQYLRHMPPLGEGTNPDLFLQPNTNPIIVTWYNKMHKVNRGRTSK